jgi:predicted Zn-dependent protease with MMP-like domain
MKQKRAEWEKLLDEAEVALGEQRHHDALQLCDRAALAGDDARYWAALLRGDVLLDMGDPAAALSSFDSAADPDVDDPELDLARGIALFELCRFPEAANALQSAVRGNPDLAEAHYTLGLVAEITSAGDEQSHFRQARRLEPERYPPHPALRRDEFEAIVDEAVAELPDNVRDFLENVPVLIADLPHPDDLTKSEPPLSPLTLGMFVGLPPGEQSVMDAPDEQPPAILLFKKNLERAFPERERLIEELRRTVLHEVGHVLGLDEQDLAERDLD